MSTGVLSPSLLPTLFLAAGAVLALSGCSLSVDVGDTDRRIETDSVTADGITALDLATDNGRVEIRGEEVAQIEIETIYDEHDRGDGSSEVHVDGDRLVITGECDGSWFAQCSVGYRIVVPRDVALAIETDNGAIELTALAGAIDVSTDNGSIHAVALRSSAVRAYTDNGAIDLSHAVAPEVVEARTDNGRIEIAVPSSDARYAVDAESDNGNVDVTVATDPSADRTIDAYSDNGRVTVRET